MSATGLAIIYIIIWWIVFFTILPIDVNRQKSIKIDGEDTGSPENPKMLKKFIYCTGITTVIFNASIKLNSCFLLFIEKVLVVFSIASSNSYINSSTS